MFELTNVKYESSYGMVELSPATVHQYLVKGKGNITEQETAFFIKMCEAQKLNPFVQGEVHLIKYDNATPAQMVIGYDTYKRRAEGNPNYIDKESGIVVKRGNEIVQKQGACLYPNEQLVGGWCRVFKLRNGREVDVYKECSFAEYNTGRSNWKVKPCMMIEKVAVSQALREAFPKDFEGLYTTEEMSHVDISNEPQTQQHFSTEEKVADIMISRNEMVAMYNKARAKFGKEQGDAVIKELLEQNGSPSGMSLSVTQYDVIMDELDNIIKEAETEAG